jgi:hypothetical protein
MRRHPIKDWPDRDRLLWERGVEPASLFGSGGAGAGWSVRSRVKTANGHNSWLSWLAANDFFDPNVGPAERVTRERLTSYVAELRGKLAPYTVLCRVQEFCDSLRVIVPEWSSDWLTQLHRPLNLETAVEVCVGGGRRQRSLVPGFS